MNVPRALSTLLLAGVIDGCEARNLLRRYAQVARTAGGTLADVERRRIVEALTQHQDRVPETANALGIGKTTLYRKLRSYGIR